MIYIKTNADTNYDIAVEDGYVLLRREGVYCLDVLGYHGVIQVMGPTWSAPLRSGEALCIVMRRGDRLRLVYDPLENTEPLDIPRAYVLMWRV